MAEPSQVEMGGDLRARWRRWTGIVRLVASRQEKRYAVDPEEYCTLHTSLLRSSQALANRGDATLRPMFRELEEILTPWVNFDSLVRANREIVCKLLDRCQAVQSVLDGRPAGHANWKPAKLALTAVAAVVAIAVLWIWAADLVPLPSLGVPPWIHRVVRVVSHGGSNGRLLILGAVATLVAIGFVWRSVQYH